MKKRKLQDRLYMFSTYNEHINLSFNQFLILGNEPLLVHTGSFNLTEKLLQKLKETLEDVDLSYVFISHFESDECGGLSLLLNQYPKLKPICSSVTARQLSGFGIFNNAIEKSPGEILELKDLHLRFIAYPSEMHLWEGLLLFEETKGLLFSSDLFTKVGNIGDAIVSSTLSREIDRITSSQIPDALALKTIKETLLKLPVNYILPGHGSVINFQSK